MFRFDLKCESKASVRNKKEVMFKIEFLTQLLSFNQIYTDTTRRPNKSDLLIRPGSCLTFYRISNLNNTIWIAITKPVPRSTYSR